MSFLVYLKKRQERMNAAVEMIVNDAGVVEEEEMQEEEVEEEEMQEEEVRRGRGRPKVFLF
jgi:hypothetical protein